MGSTKKASPFSKKVSRQDVKRNRRAKSKAPGSGSHPSSQAQLKPKPKPKPSAAPHKNKSKRRIYTEEQLDIPKLNTITPAGVRKPRGKKKGKVFVDDQESMMTILAMVNADKEGQIESKLMRAVRDGKRSTGEAAGELTSLQRQMEEIRQARQREIEARAEAKKSELVGSDLDICRKGLS